MNKSEAINWKTFKDTLLAHPDLDLQFQYAEGKLVDAAYHITEIKQAPITSVDCGGVMNAGQRSSFSYGCRKVSNRNAR
nr:DUF6428 family protein [Mucilaginibacter humi]